MASRKIEDLIPEMQALAEAFKQAMSDNDIDFIFTCTKRTQEEQNALYAQGRTSEGRIVTWTLKSKHIEGKAFDVAIIANGKITWDEGAYFVVGAIGEEIGLKWGGRFENPDMPHFELKEDSAIRP